MAGASTQEPHCSHPSTQIFRFLWVPEREMRLFSDMEILLLGKGTKFFEVLAYGISERRKWVNFMEKSRPMYWADVRWQRLQKAVCSSRPSGRT